MNDFIRFLEKVIGPDRLPFAAIGLGLLVAAGVFLWNRKLKRERREAFRRFALQNGYQYQEEKNPDEIGLPDTALFLRGRYREAENILTQATSDLTTQLCDFQYTTGSGKRKRTYRQNVVWMKSSKLSPPRFELQPETLFHKIGKVFGYKNINFETNPTFSSAYLLRGDNEMAIRAFFTPDRLHFFEQHLGLRVEGTDQTLVIYRQGKRLKVEEIQNFLQLTQRFYDICKNRM